MIIANRKKNRRVVLLVCGTALIAAAVVVALRERHPVPLPDVPVSPCPAEVRVKAVVRVNVALVSVIGAIV